MRVAGETQGVCVYPVKAGKMFARFDLGNTVWSALVENGMQLRNLDVVAVSSKFASVSEGRVVELAKIAPSEEAIVLGKRYHMEASLAQLVLEESESILGGIPGFVLSMVHGTLAPNAGIDKSNVATGWAILYPKRPNETATNLRKKLLHFSNRKDRSPKISKLGVILTDSRITPTRLGTVGIAISTSGIRPTVDLRGFRDLYGNKLKVTLRAVADQAASAAQLVMGEANESIPIAVIRGLNTAFVNPRNQFEKNMTIPNDKCLILNGLKNRTI